MTQNDANVAAKVNREFAEKFAEENAKEWGFPYVDIASFPINPDVLRLVPKADAIGHQIMPFDRHGRTIRLAIYDHKNKDADMIAKHLIKSGHETEFFICSKEGFTQALERYDSVLVNKKTVAIRHSFSEDKSDFSVIEQKFAAIESKLNSVPITTALTDILLAAIEAKASDIHFQPKSDKTIILRIRLDGILRPMLVIPAELSPKFVIQLKYDAGMKSNIRDVPQNGRIKITANRREIEFRVSTLPMEHFESVVLRVLDSHRAIRSFSALGFPQHTEKKISSALRKKNGIVLVTGPTGSGKTTTLYSMLKELNTAEQKLVTLEDPIEYHLEGVTQSEVNQQSAYNFETGFKALLRHDPDVILVGEIRTVPTAKLAFEAALTGHTVLASLHTNTSTGAIARLRNMGLENYNISPSITAVFAQRLIRRLAPGKKVIKQSLAEILKSNPSLASAIERIKVIRPEIKIPTEIIWDVENTDKYLQGQTVVCEAFINTPAVQEMILSGVSELKIRQYISEKTDFISLLEDGLIKVFAGKTTLKELIRVVGN